MHYEETGHLHSFEFVDGPATVEALRVQRDTALERAVPLNNFLAEDTLAIGVPTARAAS